MPILTFSGTEYPCERAQRGKDYVRLLDENGDVVFFADGISDFGEYDLANGEWETPIAVIAPTVGAYATLEAGAIVLSIPSLVKVENNLQVNFAAPCDCSAVTGGITIAGTTFSIVDAVGNCVTGIGGFFAKDAKVSVVLDIENNLAYLQNGSNMIISANTAESLGMTAVATSLPAALIHLKNSIDTSLGEVDVALAGMDGVIG